RSLVGRAVLTACPGIVKERLGGCYDDGWISPSAIEAPGRLRGDELRLRVGDFGLTEAAVRWEVNVDEGSQTRIGAAPVVNAARRRYGGASGSVAGEIRPGRAGGHGVVRREVEGDPQRVFKRWHPALHDFDHRRPRPDVAGAGGAELPPDVVGV